MFDYLIVGAGFAGSVLAERLARGLGKRVLICDKRSHIGGNAYDEYDSAGVLVHRYGPHIFHTNSAKVFDYLSKFTGWRSYEHRVLASVDGQLLPMPINLNTINGLYGLNLDSAGMEDFLASVAEKRNPIRNSEDAVISRVGRDLYMKFFRNYTRKQWAIDASELDAQVVARIPVRTNRDNRYFTDQFQAIPKRGFTRLFENLLDHPSISIWLNTNYREIVNKISYRSLIYSGPIDEFFDYRFGRLPYRSLEFRHQTCDRQWFQSVGVINFPNEHAYTRITEFKYLTGQVHPKTTIMYEFPQAEGDPYYPIPQPGNAALYMKYRDLVKVTPNVRFVGRLATYKYYNMDQVIAQALTLFKHIAAESGKACTFGTVDPS